MNKTKRLYIISFVLLGIILLATAIAYLSSKEYVGAVWVFISCIYAFMFFRVSYEVNCLLNELSDKDKVVKEAHDLNKEIMEHSEKVLKAYNDEYARAESYSECILKLSGELSKINPKNKVLKEVAEILSKESLENPEKSK